MSGRTACFGGTLCVFSVWCGPQDRRAVVWNPMLWRFVCFDVRKCGRCSIAARAEVRAKLWGTREAEIRTGRPTGTIFPEDPPFGLGRERSATFILLRLRFRTPFPSAEGLVPRKSGGCNPRLVCAASYKAVWRPHLRFALRRKNCFLGRLPRAGKMLPDFNRRITSVGKAAEPQAGQ